MVWGGIEHKKVQTILPVNAHEQALACNGVVNFMDLSDKFPMKQIEVFSVVDTISRFRRNSDFL
jgi:hypothetical protein